MLIGKNNKKVLKKALCLIFAWIFSINSMAAVVSDNDGSAFITKAEFDSLKNTFQSQIDSYNTSIDSKIDSSIAAYLSGITINKDPSMLFDKIKSAQGGIVHFWNEVPYVGQSTVTPQVDFLMTRHYTVKMMTNVWNLPSAMHRADGSVYLYNQIGAGGDGSHRRYSNTTDNTAANTYPDTTGGSTRFNSFGGLSWPDPPYTPTGEYWASYENNEKINYQWEVADKISGSGSCWVYHTQPNGTHVLRHFSLSYYPLQSIVAWAHTYNDKNGIKNTLNSAKYGDSTSIPKLIIPAPTDWTKTSSGTKQGDGSETNGNYWEQTLRIISTNTTRDYTTMMMGNNSNNIIYCISDASTFTSGTTTSKSISSQTFNTVYYAVTGKMGSNSVTGYTVEYTPIKYNIESTQIGAFSNQYVTPIAGETVYVGSGIPICIASSDGKINVRLEFKILSEDLVTIYNNKKLYYKLSNKKFINNAIDTSGGGKLLDSGEVTTGSDGKGLLNTTIEVKDKEYVWLTTYAEDSHSIVSVENCECKNVSS